MKSGRSLQDLAAELERQAKVKKDYLADTRALAMVVDTKATEGAVLLEGVNGGMHLRATAHAQMADNLKVPKVYYDRMLSEAPDLLAANVNHWLQKNPQRRLVRTLDSQVRAILSDSYRPLDNYELAEAVLPKLTALQATVQSSEVTERRFYLKAVTERIQGTVKVGDTVQAGLVVSNSEIGEGSLQVAALDFRLTCLNGMIREAAVRKAHLGRGGRGLDAIEDAREFFRDETRMADDRAFFLKVQDAVGSMFDQGRFEARLDQYREASAKIITADPVKVIEATAKRFSLNEAEKSSVLTHLIQGHDLSSWGLANAVTRASQDVESYDRASELEVLGGKIIELPASDWKAIALQA